MRCVEVWIMSEAVDDNSAMGIPVKNISCVMSAVIPKSIPYFVLPHSLMHLIGATFQLTQRLSMSYIPTNPLHSHPPHLLTKHSSWPRHPLFSHPWQKPKDPGTPWN